MDSNIKILAEDLMFPETPRWQDNKLWFSDMVARKVMRVDLDGKLEEDAVVPKGPSGLVGCRTAGFWWFPWPMAG